MSSMIVVSSRCALPEQENSDVVAIKLHKLQLH